MAKILLKFLWNAVPLIVVAVAGWWIINTFIAPPQPISPAPVVTVSAQPGVLDAIKSVNKQIFVEYYITKDIDYTEVPSNWLASLGLKQQFVILLKGRVPAGFDVSALDDSAIWVSADGSEVQLTLPPPVVFEEQVSLDLENSRILKQTDTCPNFLCSDASQMLLNKSLPEGKALIIADARESGILYRTALDGQRYYESLLRSLGFETVRVIVSGYTD